MQVIKWFCLMLTFFYVASFGFSFVSSRIFLPIQELKIKPYKNVNAVISMFCA